MKIAIGFTLTLLILAMGAGFCFGINFQQHREYGKYTEHLDRMETKYQSDLEELSKRNEALLDYINSEMRRIERDYEEYEWRGRQYWKKYIEEEQ